MFELLTNTIIPFLFILTILVFVHELGHYLAAIKNGVKVEVFSIGFGKELFGYTDKSGTRWKFSMIPTWWLCKNAWRCRRSKFKKMIKVI